MAVKRLKARNYTAIGRVYRPEYATTSAGFEPETPVYTGSAATLYGTDALNLTYGSVQDIPKNAVSNISIVYRACSNTGGSGAGTIKLINGDTGIYASAITLSRQSDYNNWMHVTENYVKYDLPSGVWDLILNGNWYIQVVGSRNNSSFFTIICIDIEYEESADFRIGANKLKDAFLGSILIQKIYKGAQLLYNSEKVLPAKYQEVEYIKSTGTQYFDLGYLIDDSMSVEIEFAHDGSIIDSEKLFGSFSGSPVEFSRSGTSNNFYAAINNVGVSSVISISEGTKYSLALTNSDIKINNSVASRWTAQSYSSSDGLQVCHSHDRYGNFRIYSVKVIQGGTDVKLNLVPCYKIAGGDIGLYDTINGYFYTNSGSGDFIKGPDV